MPANWELEGFGTPIYTNHPYPFYWKQTPTPPDIPDGWNPVGSYRRDFTLPKGWTDQRIHLRFGAVKSAFFLWVNGQRIGYSQGSKLPAEFDITRSPNDHLSFGVGEHFCLGANLARMELRKIFAGLLTRLPDIELAAEPRRLRSNFINGVKEMQVTFTPGRKSSD